MARKVCFQGNFEASLKTYDRGDKIYKDEYELDRAITFALMGNEKEAKNIINSELAKKDKKIVSSSNIANAYYYIGEYDNALKYLEMAIEEKDSQLSFSIFPENGKNYLIIKNSMRFEIA